MKVPDGHPYFSYFADAEKHSLRLWRYLDLPKFVSLLQTQALHFVRCDKLADPYEGKDSLRNIRAMKQAASVHESLLLKSYDPVRHQDEERKTTYISCWHMNEVESAAMWNLYTPSEHVIAIQTTYQRLTTSGAGKLVDRVKYLDFEREDPIYANALSPFFHKRKSFEHEQEVRAVRHNVLPVQEGESDFARSEDGLFIPVTLETLVEHIHVSPTARQWFPRMIQDLAEKYGLKRTVIKSSLFEGPLY